MHPLDSLRPARPAIPQLRVVDVCGGLVLGVAPRRPQKKTTNKAWLEQPATSGTVTFRGIRHLFSSLEFSRQRVPAHRRSAKESELASVDIQHAMPAVSSDPPRNRRFVGNSDRRPRRDEIGSMIRIPIPTSPERIH